LPLTLKFLNILWLAFVVVNVGCDSKSKSESTRNHKPGNDIESEPDTETDSNNGPDTVTNAGKKTETATPSDRVQTVFPPDNPWNQSIAAAEIDPNSNVLISSCGGSRLHPDFGTVYDGAPMGIPYVTVNGSQAKVPVTFDYADESDPGPYPIPRDAPIEGGANSDGDRHVIVIDTENWILYELFSATPLNGGTSWSAGSGAIFDLKKNTERPAGWTSADAAGLPIYPGLVRYDEVVMAKKVTHAFRFTCARTRRAYIPPARHFASSNTDPNLPPMGMRVRLKADFDTSPYPASVQPILQALKTYGMINADNGSGFFISGAPDHRWNDEDLNSLKNVIPSDFEVVRMVGLVTE
jgi:hypothetical protein